MLRHGAECKSEAILRGELKATLLGTDRVLLRDLPEGGIGNTGVRVAIADIVEGIEGIEVELKQVLLVDTKILEGGQVEVAIGGPAQGTVARCAEAVGCRQTEGADTVIYAGVKQGLAEGSVPNH